MAFRKRVYAGPSRGYAKRRKFTKRRTAFRRRSAKKVATYSTRSSGRGTLYMKKKPFNKRKWISGLWTASNDSPKYRSYSPRSVLHSTPTSGNLYTVNYISQYPVDLHITTGGGETSVGAFGTGVAKLFIRGGISKLSFVRGLVDSNDVVTPGDTPITVDKIESPTIEIRVWACWSKRGINNTELLAMLNGVTRTNGWDPTTEHNPDWHKIFTIGRYYEKVLGQEDAWTIEERIRPRTYDIDEAENSTINQNVNHPFWIYAMRSLQDTVAGVPVIRTCTHNATYTGDRII